jgi:hypothetical protein
MASRKEAREAVAEDLRALADDLKDLVQDPKLRKQRERRWGVLYGAVGLVMTLAARRLAARAWSILTGEQPPASGLARQPSKTHAERHAAYR